MIYFVCFLIDLFKIFIGYVDFEFKILEKFFLNGQEKLYSLKGMNMWYNIYFGIVLWKVLFQKYFNFYIILLQKIILIFFIVKIIIKGLWNG